ncbi:MAG: homoserine dehydrogenase [Sphingobacteriales bacterium]|nr:MAG: homoserine dehydrogenase [Sphingobacteriales bacterium]
MSTSTPTLRIGLFGFGTVGESLYQVLRQTPTLRGDIQTVVIKHPEKPRNAPAHLFTTDPDAILTDETLNVVVELIDDADAAYQIVKTALQNGKAVVSANKKMIAEHLDELLYLQRTHQVPFLYESAACASIPVIRNLEEYYDNDLLHGLQGIVNGSTNYILTRMAREGLSFEAALKQAQNAGFAESDPSLDVNGIDAVNKLTILLAHAYGIVGSPNDLVHSGIQHLHPQDAVVAREKGYVIKLIAQARKLTNGQVAAFVLPQFVPAHHLLAPVSNEYNGVIIESGLAENQFFYGKGAGGIATASAVLSDLSALRYGYRYEYKKRYNQEPGELSNDFYVRLQVTFSGRQPIPNRLFEQIEEYTCTGRYTTVVGILHFAKLLDTSWWQNPQTSLVLCPDPILEILPEAADTLAPAEYAVA